jgi:hypothetical protein
VVELGDTFLKEETNTFLSGECDACRRYIKALRWRRVRFGGGGKSVSVGQWESLDPRKLFDKTLVESRRVDGTAGSTLHRLCKRSERRAPWI